MKENGFVVLVVGLGILLTILLLLLWNGQKNEQNVLDATPVSSKESGVDHSGIEVWGKGEVSIRFAGNKVGEYFTEGEGNYLGRESRVGVVERPEDGVYLIEEKVKNGDLCGMGIFLTDYSGTITRRDYTECVVVLRYDSEVGKWLGN